MRRYVSGKELLMRISIVLLLFLFFCPVVFAQQYAGTYTTIIGEADVPPDMKAAVGNWELILGDEGQFTTMQNGEVVVRGTYAVTADQMTFSDAEGSMACTGEQATGAYGFALESGTLTFTLVDDDCPGRRIVLLTRPLTKQTAIAN
jgi:hypothetical protein